jgi:diguanylate cyclase (GGDEF)-like protein
VSIQAAVRARDPRAAAHNVQLVLVVCAVAVAGLTVFTEQHASWVTQVASWTVVALLVGAAGCCRYLAADRLDRRGFFLAVPLVGIGMILALNLQTQDASTAAQAFLAFPVLWSGVHLRRGALVGVTAAALAAEGVVLLLIQPLEGAVTDLVFFGAVLVLMAVLLGRSTAVQERLVAVLQEQARVDALTGLVNRRVFDGALEEALRAPVPGGTALVLIDVDAFKTINDSFGHPVGDAVLVHLATVLRGQVREGDAVLSRLGGDELAVLLPGCTAPVAARRAEELLEAVHAAPMTLPDGTLLSLSISVGVAHADAHEHALSGLYSAADAALYRAKRAGRGRVAVASA